MEALVVVDRPKSKTTVDELDERRESTNKEILTKLKFYSSLVLSYTLHTVFTQCTSINAGLSSARGSFEIPPVDHHTRLRQRWHVSVVLLEF